MNLTVRGKICILCISIYDFYNIYAKWKVFAVEILVNWWKIHIENDRICFL